MDVKRAVRNYPPTKWPERLLEWLDGPGSPPRDPAKSDPAEISPCDFLLSRLSIGEISGTLIVRAWLRGRCL